MYLEDILMYVKILECILMVDRCILTPKERRSFLSKNTSNLPILAQEAQKKRFLFFTFNRKILP
jgi:hypothetical protein